jgi:hypothetical protein
VNVSRGDSAVSGAPRTADPHRHESYYDAMDADVTPLFRSMSA